MTLNQIQKFTGNWIVDSARKNNFMSQLNQSMVVSEKGSDFVVETESKGNKQVNKYNLNGEKTISEIISDMEHSTFTHTLEFQEKEDRLILHSHRLMQEKDKSLVVDSKSFWEFEENAETLKVTYELVVFDPAKEKESPKQFISYFKKQ